MTITFITKIRSYFGQRYKFIVLLFFILFLLIGLLSFRDYGISWDEPIQRELGLATMNYVFNGEETLLGLNNKFYGPVFTASLTILERIFGISDNLRAIYFMRHLVTFLLFYSSVYFFYKLCKYSFRSWKIGLLGSFLLVLSPRIFADSFFNSKDIVFMAVFIISIYTMIQYLNNKTWFNAIFHAISCAFLIDIRLLGIIVPLLTYLFFVADLLIGKDHKLKIKQVFLNFFIYIILLSSLTILFWPALWKDPLNNFIEAFKLMSAYPWDGNLLYLGKFIKGSEVPWHYIPLWIAISTPVLYTFFFLFGFFNKAKLLLKNPIDFYAKNRDDYIFILWFFLPLASVILLKSVLYDGWRQMFFIYPAFLIISISGILSVFKYIKSRFKGPSFKALNIFFILIIMSSLVYTGVYMIRYHPYQNIYFNPIAGRDMKIIKNNFELDYWGLSFREALEYILDNDKSSNINIYVADSPGLFNSLILIPADRNRLVYVGKPEEAKYFISNYRYHPGDYPYKNEYYSIKIGNAKIMVVYKLK